MSVLSLTNLIYILVLIISILSQIFILSVISWYLIKTIRKCFNNEIISSNKRAVLITGCDTGIGNASALALNNKGFRVYATVLDPECSGSKGLIKSACFPERIHVLRMDVTKEDEVSAVCQQIEQQLQENGEELWAVVNNAGILSYGPLDWGTVDNYKEVFEVNTFGAVRVTRAFLPLIRQSKGRIVNNLSISARITLPLFSAYAMSKSATLSFSDGLRRENHKWNIRVSTIEATLFKTPINSVENFQKTLDQMWAQTSAQVKQEYGQQYYQSLRDCDLLGVTLKDKIGNDISKVVDKIVDGVQSLEPQIYYHVAPSFYTYYFTKLILYLPPELQDLLVSRLY